MASSGMLRHVALVRVNVSEEYITSVIRVTRIGELEMALAVNSNRNTLQINIQDRKNERKKERKKREGILKPKGECIMTCKI
jgi:hypothetical protein